MPKIAWLIFIRANSTRFPRKCYHLIKGKNIFSHLLSSSVSASIPSGDIYLCTTSGTENHHLVDQAYTHRANVLFGPEDHPIKRITQNWDRLCEYDYLVRICGDSPLYPFSIAKRAINQYCLSRLPNAITNTRIRNFPSGLSVEAYHINALKYFFHSYSDQCEKEHMSSILKHDYFCNNLTVDLRTKDALDFFHFPKYTVDFLRDVEVIETCISNGYDLFYSDRLASIELI